MSSITGSIDEVMTPETRSRLGSAGILDRIRLGPRGMLRPIMVVCETINICNADCVFCAYHKQTRKRGLMSMQLFRKVIADYDQIGGGYFSLTPMVGDVLLDRDLPKRLDALARYKSSIFPTVTTNLLALGRLSDGDIGVMLEHLHKLHVSVIGITQEECEMLARKDLHSRLISNLKRLASLWETSSQSCEIEIGFRLAHQPTRESLDHFLLSACGRVFPYRAINQYANWGGALSGRLPAEARYYEPRDNSDSCVLLLVAMQVYWDGRVTACSCCDYDASDELYLGNIRETSLSEIFNHQLNRRVWQQHEAGRLPGICKKCTFHIPLCELDRNHPIAVKITDFIGG